MVDGKAADTVNDFRLAAQTCGLGFSTVFTENVEWEDSEMFPVTRYVMLDNNPYCAAVLESRGACFINSGYAIMRADSKALTYALAAGVDGVSMPRTWVVPYYHIAGDTSWIYDYSTRFSLLVPVIVKVDDSMQGTGVFLARTVDELAGIIGRNSGRRMVVQDYVQSSNGRDIRLFIVHGEVSATVTRISEKDFRSNTALGGRMEVTTVDDEYHRIAVHVLDTLGLTYGTVDFLTNGDTLLLNEVNARPRTRTITNLVGRNIAEDIVSPLAPTFGGDNRGVPRLG